jgi:hypothetical protein
MGDVLLAFVDRSVCHPCPTEIAQLISTSPAGVTTGTSSRISRRPFTLGIIGLSSFIDIGASGIARIVSNLFYRDASREQKLDFEPRSPLNSVHIPAKANTRHHHWAARG